MERENCSSLTEFIFLGITDNTENKVILFTMFLPVYLINLLANLGMITLIRMDPQLHTPMYFFLSHLSFCDLCYSTAIGPKMLMDLFAKNKSISFCGCALQFLVFCIFADSECLLLAVMAYDRYKAISSPLLYAVSMSSRVCSLLMPGVFLVGIPVSQVHTPLAFHLCFCGSNVIDHFFLWFTSVFFFFSPSCSDIQVNELMMVMLWVLLNLVLFQGPLLLFLYHPFSLEDPLCWRESQSFYHRHLPLNCSVNLPGNSTFYVFQAKFILLSRWRQNDLFVLNSCDSPAKFSYI